MYVCSNMKSTLYTNLCIVGAGPAGATLSLFLSQQQIPHVIVDQAIFPRDKVCGDGITLEVLHTLKLLHLLEDFIQHPDFLPCWVVKTVSPSGKPFYMRFDPNRLPYAPLFTARRSDFDTFLVSRLPSDYATVMIPAQVKHIERIPTGIKIRLTHHSEGIQEIYTPLIIGADGERSIVHRFLGNQATRSPFTTAVGMRTYITPQDQLAKDPTFEFHFASALLPGYYWAFPLADGGYNVGIYAPQHYVSALKLNLRRQLYSFLHSHPFLANSVQLQDHDQPLLLTGWTLSLNNQRRLLAGDNYMLLGDAGALIEPFLGKGIGVGMLSAKIAALHIQKAMEKRRFDAVSLKAYHLDMYKRYATEWKWSKILQQYFRSSFLVDMTTHIGNLSSINQLLDRKIHPWISRWM